VASITGAYMAGLFIGRTPFRQQLIEHIEVIGHSLFVSIFFVFIGLRIDLASGSYHWPFILGFVVLAILSKALGAGFLARLGGFSTRSSFIIGSGMIPRGEVALVIASIGLSQPQFFGTGEFTATVILVIVSSLLTPLLLNAGYAGGTNLKEVQNA